MARMSVLALLLASFCISNQEWAATTYTVTDLGTLGGTFSSAKAINNLGQVIGMSDYEGGYSNSGFFYDGTIQDIGHVGDFPFSTPQGINVEGLVVGVCGNSGSELSFNWSHGVLTSLGINTPTNTYDACAINNLGQIVGQNKIQGEATDAFLLNNPQGMPVEIPQLSTAVSINNSGLIAGTSTNNHAAIFDTALGIFTDLGTLGGSTSRATAVNDDGQIIGQSQMADGSTHGFLYSDNSLIDLGTFIPSAINNEGDIIGTSGSYPFYHDTLMHRDGSVDLLDALIGSTWNILDLTGINDLGQIVGRGSNAFLTDDHAILLTPVPGPASLPLLAGGVILLLSWCRHRRRRLLAPAG